MSRKLHNLGLRLKPARFDLGNGDSVRLCRFLGSGLEKDVYKIWGRKEILKVLKEHVRGGKRAGCILSEVRDENTLRSIGIPFAATHRYDPKGHWVIKEYVREPTIRHLIKRGSEIMYSSTLVSALADVLERLRHIETTMDMGTPNWVLTSRGNAPRLLSLEPVVSCPTNDTYPWPFENTLLPIWLGHRSLFRISPQQLAAVKKAWETEPKFAFWRQYFGSTFPQLGRQWQICE